MVPGRGDLRRHDGSNSTSMAISRRRRRPRSRPLTPRLPSTSALGQSPQSMASSTGARRGPDLGRRPFAGRNPVGHEHADRRRDARPGRLLPLRRDRRDDGASTRPRTITTACWAAQCPRADLHPVARAQQHDIHHRSHEGRQSHADDADRQRRAERRHLRLDRAHLVAAGRQLHHPDHARGR